MMGVTRGRNSNEKVTPVFSLNGNVHKKLSPGVK